jgi:hypothetical protein
MFCWDTLVVVRGGMSLFERSLDLYFLGFYVTDGLGVEKGTGDRSTQASDRRYRSTPGLPVKLEQP